MGFRYFNYDQLAVLGEALVIAEDMTSNYFKLSLSQWKKYRYDVKTLTSLFGENIKTNVFALLRRYIPEINRQDSSASKIREFYVICLQDHQILKALRRDRGIDLLSLLAYILTHELVHIIRFCTFQIRFDTEDEKRRLREEEVVHETTYEILKGLSLPSLPYILNSYHPDKLNIDSLVT